jgi:hypothetical protein
MKINDVIIKEAGFADAYAMRNTQTLPVTTSTPGPGTAGGQAVHEAAAPVAAPKKAAPKKAAPKKSLPPGNVPPQPTLKGKPSTGPKGQAWLKKYGATHNPDGSPKAAAPAVAPAATGQDAPSAELDRLKQLAIGGSQPAPAPATAEPAAPTPPPNVNALGIAQAANVSNPLQPAPQADTPAPAPAPAPDLAADLAAAQNSGSSYTGNIGTATNDALAGQTAQPANVNPDTGASTVAPPVKTSSGGTLTSSDGKAVTSRSNDEIAWANANPANRFNPNGYPGPGNWDPRTGRTKTAKESTELALIRKLSGL